MITFICLLCLLLLALICLAAIGVEVIIAFGDVLLCIGLIVLIVKLVTKKNGSQN